MLSSSTHLFQQQQQNNHFRLLLWYIGFGAVHEVAHLTTASILGYDVECNGDLLYRILLGRQVTIQGIQLDHYHSTIIQHAGWVVSATLAAVIFGWHLLPSSLRQEKQRRWSNTMLLAVAVTALEALSTDLFGWSCLHVLPLSSSNKAAGACSFFCGNFGIILLNHLWLSKDNGKSALECLEKMINVTMMRGAQSGGIVTYQPYTKGGGLKGIRSRVLNKKRTDLSREILKRIRNDFRPSKIPEDFVSTLVGHTRFATSSISSFECIHPHQWTPERKHMFYDFSILRGDLSASRVGPKATRVSNYITHNGDFDFYVVNGKTYDLEIIQKWLSVVTETPIPAIVDSCAIAGMIDILRTQGCFGLSVRYAVCLGLESSEIEESPYQFPSYKHFESIGRVFEKILDRKLETTSLHEIGDSVESRKDLVLQVLKTLKGDKMDLIQPLNRAGYMPLVDAEAEGGGASLYAFCKATVDAFFDNDLLMATQIFLKNAKGSFGLCVTSSLDAHRQICLAARGQTVSIGFFPKKELICYGSEQAAVKAGINATFPGGRKLDYGHGDTDMDKDATRLDLDDLGGEIVILDWGSKKFQNQPISYPNRHLPQHEVMNGTVRLVISKESKSTTLDRNLYHRLTRLSRNEMIKPLQEITEDPILTDIQDIPRVCSDIQDDWHANKAATSLNRLTAFNLSTCLRARLEGHVKGQIPSKAVDILLTGCEVSLWLAEQFASDLQKCFPKLRIQSLSSNKVLGIYGQEIAVPSFGFPYSEQTSRLNDSIIIIVSHSGGTFAPLACSNLLQSFTKNIFVVTSEWDTQIGKQLRAMNELEDGEEHLLNHRIFSTEVGRRPAEPCSISVVATQQLLTNLFEYISVVILSDPRFRRVSGAIITDEDIKILERCNRMNLDAMTELVGANFYGPLNEATELLISLQKAGDLWAEHILENAKAYIITFFYIFVTVIFQVPVVSACAKAAGVDLDGRLGYIVRIIDSAIYFWLPQINIILLRLVQGRNLRHRMVGRTVVIGDIPWVAQCADAFLSKIFAVSYSIAGVNVLSGNPSDHFCHRHTHRVMRGTLAIFGRPDGRLSALSTAEASVCLSVNQASSIQSMGGTCESITIGHNPFELDLAINGIFLKRFRPLFLCERLLVEDDLHQEKRSWTSISAKLEEMNAAKSWRVSCFQAFTQCLFGSNDPLASSRFNTLDCSIALRFHKLRSPPALLGAYRNIDDNKEKKETLTVDDVVDEVISNRNFSNQLQKIYQSMDLDHDGLLSRFEFINGVRRFNSDITEEEATILFHHGDTDATGFLTYKEFDQVVQDSRAEFPLKMPPSNRDHRGIIQIEGVKEKYFGEKTRKYNAGDLSSKDMEVLLARSQHLVQELYETRIASMQRFIAMVVMFHRMGKRVQTFFSRISFGLLAYRMDRTHSNLRVATTASPVSGADVRQRMAHLRLLKKVQLSVDLISRTYLAYKERKEQRQVNDSMQKAHGREAVLKKWNQEKQVICQKSFHFHSDEEEIVFEQESSDEAKRG